MTEIYKQWDEEATLQIAGVRGPLNDIDRALLNRFLEIHQGDPSKAGVALRRHLMSKQ